MNDQVQKVIRHPATVPGGVGVLCFGVGMGLGFLLGRKTKKNPPADLHVLPTLDLDVKVDEASTRKLDSYILESEAEATIVIETMKQTISDYGSISVADFRELLGFALDEGEDDEWGWKELDYALVEKGKDGYILILPDPVRLDEGIDDDDEDDDSPVLAVVEDEKLAAGRDFIKNRFALPDLPNDDDLVEVEDEAEDEESEEEEEPVSEEGEPVEAEATRRENAFEDGGDTWDLLKEMKSRTESAPYVLHRDEFYAEEKGFRQYSLTYFSGDQLMVDEDDKVLYDWDRTVGALKWGHGSGNPLVFYVRNEKFKAEYEITFVEGSFSDEGLGYESEKDQRVRGLEHSAEPRRFRDREG